MCESLSHVQLCNPMDCSCWAPLSMKFSRPAHRVSCHFLLQGIFPTQGSNPGLLHCRQILYHLSHQGRLYKRSYSRWKKSSEHGALCEKEKEHLVWEKVWRNIGMQVTEMFSVSSPVLQILIVYWMITWQAKYLTLWITFIIFQKDWEMKMLADNFSGNPVA